MSGRGPGRKPKLPRSERSLACVIQALEGMRLVVELRQDTIIRGVLESADEEMNLVMKTVILTPLEGEKKELEWLYVKGHHIRYPPPLLSPLRRFYKNT
jgi:small nuclear ribonucleoprotein (snRNP)-like protein